MNRSLLIATAWALTATLLFTLLFASGRLAEGGASAAQLLFLRFISGSLLVSVYCLMKAPYAFGSRNWPLHAGRAFCGSNGGLLIIQAATLLPLAQASALGLTEGVIGLLLAVILLKERLGLSQSLASLLCLIGAAITVLGDLPQSAEAGVAGTFASIGHPAFWQGAQIQGIACALGGAFLIALEGILMKFQTNRDSLPAILLWVNYFGLFFTGLWAAFTWQTLSLPIIIGGLLLGPLALTAQACNLKAYALAPASFLIPIYYAWLPYAGLLGWLLFAEIPGPALWIGGAILLLGGVLLTRSNPQEGPRAKAMATEQ
ncbi:DMT family transporter [Rhodovibrionaceae bacterium A322]